MTTLFTALQESAFAPRFHTAKALSGHYCRIGEADILKAASNDNL
jgi:hypothetical protein